MQDSDVCNIASEKHTILLIEDNPLTVKLVKLTLQTEGYNVESCESGKDALAKLQSLQPDLILQDIHLPDIDGLQLIKELRAIPSSADIPIIAFSGFVSMLEESRIANSGFNDFLLKPVEPSLLIKCIKGHLLNVHAKSETPTHPHIALIIDDDPLQLKFTGLQFNHAGFTVITAVDGLDGLEKAKKFNVDVIVSDVLMPKMDGFQLCKALREIPKLKTTPIILVSANYIEEIDRNLAKLIGANAYVYRSLGIQTIIDTALSCMTPTAKLAEPKPPQKESHIESELQTRMMQQLERQVSLNLASRQRNYVQNSILGQIGIVADSFSQSNDNQLELDDILARCLDSADLTQGAFYHLENFKLTLRAQFGFSDSLNDLHNCFNNKAVFLQLVQTENPVAIPSQNLMPRVNDEILKKSKAQSALLVPVDTKNGTKGLFIMFSNSQMLTDDDWISFGKTLALQYAQATELSDTFIRLVDSEQRFTQLADNVKEAFFLLDLVNDKIIYLSAAYEKIWKTSCESLIENPYSMLESILAVDQARFLYMLKQIKNTGKCNSEIRIKDPDGNIKCVLICCFPIYDDSGKLNRVAGTAEDITVRKNFENANKRLNSLFALLSGINTLAVRVDKREELFEGACRLAVEIGGFDHVLIGLIKNGSFSQIVEHSNKGVNKSLTFKEEFDAQKKLSQSKLVLKAIDSAKPQWQSTQTDELKGPLNICYPMEDSFNSVIYLPLLKGKDVIGIVNLLSKREIDFNPMEIKLLTELAKDIAFALTFLKNKDKLNYLAFHDPLTGLNNRTTLINQLQTTIEKVNSEDEGFGLMLININHFRDINDTLGHKNGDRLLNEIAKRLVKNSKNPDLVACLGGDEFAMVIPNLKEKRDISKIANKLNQALLERFMIDDVPILIEARIGIALYPSQGLDADALWRHADVALAAAKRHKELYCLFHEKYDHFDPKNLSLLSEIREAIDKDEFVLHWQPKVDFKTKKTTSVEALIRWQHPTRGLIFPDAFIPFVEQTALIKPLTYWVIANAIKQAKEWDVVGYDLGVAINISVRNLQEKDIDQQILDLADAVDFPVENIIIEITESAVMENAEKAKLALSKLRNAGIQIAIDDFGIGQSSLTYLKDLPVTDMKIDKSFIMEIDTLGNTAIVKSSIDLAHNLNLSTTAEGIENQSTYELLETLACDVAQGYYISRPLTNAKLSEWLSSTKWPCKKKAAIISASK